MGIGAVCVTIFLVFVREKSETSDTVAVATDAGETPLLYLQSDHLVEEGRVWKNGDDENTETETETEAGESNVAWLKKRNFYHVAVVYTCALLVPVVTLVRRYPFQTP